MDCQAVKAWLSQEGIPFVEQDIHADPQAAGDLKNLTGRVLVPVVAFNEMDVVVGAKMDRLRQLARAYGYLKKSE
jgi:glutaredoxin